MAGEREDTAGDGLGLAGLGDGWAGLRDGTAGLGDLGFGEGDGSAGLGDGLAGLGDLGFGEGDGTAGLGDGLAGLGDRLAGLGDLTFGDGDCFAGLGDLGFGEGDGTAGLGDLGFGEGDARFGDGDRFAGLGDLGFGDGEGLAGLGLGHDFSSAPSPFLFTLQSNGSNREKGVSYPDVYTLTPDTLTVCWGKPSWAPTTDHASFWPGLAVSVTVSWVSMSGAIKTHGLPADTIRSTVAVFAALFEVMVAPMLLPSATPSVFIQRTLGADLKVTHQPGVGATAGMTSAVLYSTVVPKANVLVEDCRNLVGLQGSTTRVTVIVALVPPLKALPA